MSKRLWFGKEEELAGRLRQEAIQSRPEFSEELHRRLWHALERSEGERSGGLDGGGLSQFSSDENGTVPLRLTVDENGTVPLRIAPLRVASRRAQGPAVSRRWPFWATATLAAAGLLSAVVIGWRPRDVVLRPQSVAGGAAVAVDQRGGGNPSQSVVPGSASADPHADVDVVAGLADHVATRLDTLLDSAVTTQGWAYLDHDARLAMQFLTDRIPSNPAAP